MTTDTPAPAEALSNLEQATQAVNRQLGGKLYQHRKGGVYLAYQRRSVSIGHKAGEFIFSGIMGAPLILATDDIEEEEEIVCYRNVVTGDGYARPARLFDDGRFTPLTLAPAGLLARAEAAEAERDRLLAGLEKLTAGWSELTGVGVCYAAEEVREVVRQAVGVEEASHE